jgi:two-component system response regulator
MGEEQNIIKILLVEDNPDDIAICKRALKEAKVINKLWIARDGQEALDFLTRQDQYKDPESSPMPGLILLDLNLPKVKGLDVLKKIKEDPELKKIPVVILTVSKRDEDIVKGYTRGCNSFIQKPVDFDKFVQVVKEISLYWGLFNIESPNMVEQE